MNAHQRRLRSRVEVLIEIARQQGLSSGDLRELVTGLIRDRPYGMSDRDKVKNRAFSARVNKAGMMAQIYYLLQAMGEARLISWLKSHGSELDAFVRGYSSSDEDRERDVGRNNVDWDGCVTSE